jgi:predicted enzyme related to lactoylglutathione lyase
MIRRTIPVLALAALTACSSKLPVVPPVSPTATGTHHVGKFVWYDLITHDVDAAERFYGALLGWEFHDADGDRRYITILHQGRAIGGMAQVKREAEEANVTQWVSWLSVADVDDATAAAAAAGATVLREPRDIPERGRFALVSDPQGAIVALLRSGTGDPPDADDVAANEWLWTELWTHDVADAFAFYSRWPATSGRSPTWACSSPTLC